MLRSLLNSCVKVRSLAQISQNVGVGILHSVTKPQLTRCFSALVAQNPLIAKDTLASNQHSLCKTPCSNIKQPLILQQQARTVVKFSFSGKRQTVKSVPARFRRLDWGIWIRRIAGSHKKLWKKSIKRRMRLDRHVFVNATRSYMLDKMVSNYWRTPKYWVDDPYAPYQKREEFLFTRSKPRPLPPGVEFSNNS